MKSEELFKLGIKIGREAERYDEAFKRKMHGVERRTIERAAAASRWFLICLACDHRLETQPANGPKRRDLPDLATLFAENAETIADVWKLGPDEPRRESFIKAFLRKGVTADTIAVATQYMNARLDGLAPDAAKKAVKGWSRFRP
ncbi:MULTISPECIES: hypothetical protein [unclassified Ruegeria]|uniref:hypothetical protein n=1 Tax=unclassified Ruegeria TaxID=2625375 RepID=UPI001491035E|nr:MULTISPECIES: hypothetical protein [unclassified Ruegeria]NOD36021.1 hypothetical protein [Ruegeria sp. HKCCD7296]NOE43414.1 hypothetical protein [Ruegeria sp. HKCCD7319]